MNKFTLDDEGLCNGWVMGRALVDFSPNLNSAGGPDLPCRHFPICEDHFIGVCYYSSAQITTPYKHAMGLLHFSMGILPTDWLSEHAQLARKIALSFSYKHHQLPWVTAVLLARVFLTPQLQRSCSQRTLLLNKKRLIVTISYLQYSDRDDD